MMERVHVNSDLRWGLTIDEGSGERYVEEHRASWLLLVV